MNWPRGDNLYAYTSMNRFVLAVRPTIMLTKTNLFHTACFVKSDFCMNCWLFFLLFSFFVHCFCIGLMNIYTGYIHYTQEPATLNSSVGSGADEANREMYAVPSLAVSFTKHSTSMIKYTATYYLTLFVHHIKPQTAHIMGSLTTT